MSGPDAPRPSTLITPAPVSPGSSSTAGLSPTPAPSDAWVSANPATICHALAWAWMLVVLTIGCLTVGDYGITTDEPIRAYTGANWWRWLADPQPEFLPQERLRYYGALYDMVGVVFAEVHTTVMGGGNPYTARHFLNFLTLWMGLWGTYVLGRRLAPDHPQLPLAALVIFTLMPRWYGSFNNPKDIPFATAIVWTAWALLGWLARPSWQRTLTLALGIGLTTAVRPYGVLWIPIAIITALAVRGMPMPARPAAAAGPSTSSPPDVFSPPSAWCVARLIVIGLAACYALWPTLWVSPPSHLLDALRYLSKFPDGGASLFFSEMFNREDFVRRSVTIALSPSGRWGLIVPAHVVYIPTWTIITTPAFTLLLALVGLVAALNRRQHISPAPNSPPDTHHLVPSAGLLGWLASRDPRWIFIVLWLLLPWIAAVIKGVNYSRTGRHFYFLLPPLALLAALGLTTLAALAARARLAWLIWVLAVAAAFHTGATMVRLHPYQSLYFAEVIGGIPGARDRFDVENWGQSLHEAFNWLAANAARKPARVHAGLGRDPLGGEDTSGFHAARLGLVHNPTNPEYFISVAMQGREKRFPGRVVHTVYRDDTPLAVVVQLDPWIPLTRLRAGPASTLLTSDDGRFDLTPLGLAIPRLEGYSAEDSRGVPVDALWQLDSPTRQTVTLLLGFKGPGQLRINGSPPRELPDRLRFQPHSAFAGMHVIHLELQPGVNRLALTAQLRHDPRLYVHWVAAPGVVTAMAR